VDLSQYQLEALRKDEEFVLYRGVHSNHSGLPSILLLAPASNRPHPFPSRFLYLYLHCERLIPRTAVNRSARTGSMLLSHVMLFCFAALDQDKERNSRGWDHKTWHS
jgi:hypothetical protein